MRYQGKLEHWKDDKGFGFVEPNGGGKRAFVHIKAFKPRSRRPVEGDIISYTLVQQGRDKYKAEEVEFSGARDRLKPPRKSNNDGALALILIAVFFMGLTASVAIGYLLPVVIGFYLMMSLVTFMAYASDKSAAREGRWRTQEDVLHLLAIFGGWPGALLAQSRLRHKSSKKAFKIVFWATVLFNLAGLAWLYTESGTSFLNGLLSAIG
jgi:uncharacterized membrane protein YsdA (DUF1294 family)/cold shock CspA family protein